MDDSTHDSTTQASLSTTDLSQTQSQPKDLSFNISQDDRLFAQAGKDPIRYDRDNPVLMITQAWIDERNAPELLPYKRHIVETLIELLEQQTEMVMEDMSSTVENKFISMVYQTEIERIKYLVKSYLRTRLHKIEKFTLQLLRTSGYDLIMSPQEIIYARRYQELLEAHNHESFLHLLPRSQHRQDESHGGLNMVTTADMEAPVFCRVMENVGQVSLGGESQLLEKGEIYIVRYSDIKHLVQDGRLQLI
ncbi:uncharacterized protein BYT42DRAFT_542599 [Radiomyces spectabilis]|uniref:uncharacterized protein n=1 Tax=Radiomyces spectabilis TaxID=64574 RepID=UPI00221E92D2|nr:uncharacterized protein BYT42DRAFT_542599 [Radiomyces spectabilis]KAI8390965.1 hypothetical protein BYT42DRAFT_542599 [Radiomyces spectabilis]